jgi:hypothetical protein
MPKARAAMSGKRKYFFMMRLDLNRHWLFDVNADPVASGDRMSQFPVGDGAGVAVGTGTIVTFSIFPCLDFCTFA